MVMAAFMQALISATIKGVSSSTPISVQIAFYYLIPVFYFLPFFAKHGFSVYKPKKFLIHFVRGFFSIASVSCFFYAIKFIPLGMSTTLFNMIPFFVPIAAYFLLKEKIYFKTYIGLSVALLGILLIINPRIASFSFFHFSMGLSAAILMAVSMVLLRLLINEKESLNQVVFNQYSSCSLIALVFVGLEAYLNPEGFTFLKTNLSTLTIFLLIGLGVLSIGTQYCFSKAAQHMPVSQFAPFLYLSVPVSSLLGLLIWEQDLSLAMAAGSLLIFGGLCICTLLKEKVIA